MGRDVSVSTAEMLSIVARAKLSERTRPAADIVEELRSLDPWKLTEEFHRSVAILSKRRLLSATEERRLHDYAREHFMSPSGSNAA